MKEEVEASEGKGRRRRREMKEETEASEGNGRKVQVVKKF